MSLRNLLDIVNETPSKPDWIGVYHEALDSDMPAWQLLQLAKVLWLESNDPEAYDALVADLED